LFMTILALEFSTPRRSVAVARGGTLLAEAVEETSARGTDAFRLIEQALAAAKISREAVEVIAVGLGPGSYTGIRAAIAVAQGWQLARGTKLLGVSSVAALARQAQAEKFFGTVNLAVDAQRGEFYLAGWAINATECTEIFPLKIVPAAEISARRAAGEICLGPDLEQKMFPSAAMVAGLAASRSDFVPGNRLEPVYLREASFVKSPAGRMI
jgi:tRNA threonylcarbamoyladenosine biosynthesis protein TsaB